MNTPTLQLDQQRLESLYSRLEKPLVNVVYRWLWDQDDAQDVVQDAFVRVWRMRKDVDVRTVEPLLYKIALNLAKNRLRRRRIWRWVSLEALFEQRSPARDAEEQLSTNQRTKAVRLAVEALPEKLRSVIMLCEFSELTYDEIADVLAIPPGTVASRRHTALERLRKSYGSKDARFRGDDRRQGATR